MAGGVDGHHVLASEVPLHLRVQEGHHEAPAGAVNVDLDVPALLLVEFAWHAINGQSPGYLVAACSSVLFGFGVE